MLRQLFELYNFTFDEETFLRFEKFLEIFKEKNNQINLSSIRDESGIIEKHFIDSLMLTKFIKLSGKVADIGTGGGFPLIPLSIVNSEMMKGKIKDDNLSFGTGFGINKNIKSPLNDSESSSEGQQGLIQGRLLSSQEGQKKREGYNLINDNGKLLTQFYGIDSVGKKLKAIDDFAKELGLENIKTIHTRFEDIGQDRNQRETFDFVVSRATAYLPTLLEYAIPLLKVGGTFIAYKLDNNDEIKEGENALKNLNSEIIDVKKYSLGGTDRTLVFVKKIGTTPGIYPRNSGIPLKKPIV